MASVYDAQLNVCAESAYGTYTSSGARSLQFNSESLEAVYERVTSNGIKAGRFLAAEENSLPVAKGVRGSVSLNPTTKGFGLVLKNMLGASSVGSLSSGKYPQTHTLGALTGTSLSMQVYRPFSLGASGTTWTYTGCKVTDWSLAASVDNMLSCDLSITGKAATTGTALVAAAYASSPEPFVWASTTITIGGTSYYATGFSLKGTNGLKADRWKLGGVMEEPTEDKERTITGSVSGIDYNDATLNAYVAASTNAAMYAQIVITCLGQTDTANLLTITMPKCRIDSGLPNVSAGNLVLEQPIAYTVMTPSSGSAPISIAYTSTDSAI